MSHIKEYYQRFKKTMVSMEDCVLLIFKLDADIVEFLVYIQLNKVLGTLEFRH